jgi:hypothetical protein
MHIRRFHPSVCLSVCLLVRHGVSCDETTALTEMMKNFQKLRFLRLAACTRTPQSHAAFISPAKLWTKRKKESHVRSLFNDIKIDTLIPPLWGSFKSYRTVAVGLKSPHAETSGLRAPGFRQDIRSTNL